MDTHTLAYLAGAIDADGHISIQRTRKNVKKNTCGPVIYYYPKFGLTQITDAVPNLLRDTFGGNVYNHQPKNPKHQLWYIYQSSNSSGCEYLSLLLPYLRIKRRQAELAISLGRMIADQWATIKATQIPPYRITADMNTQRCALWEECTRLNKPKNRRVHFESAA